jgi:Ca2+-binding RTX toxin-like protein
MVTPLTLDLNDDGVKTMSVLWQTFFDHDGDGFAEMTGWVDPNDGLLVRDLNENGQIDDGAELFGNNTILANGNKASNGFEALAELDSNGDGIIDANDDEWDTLKIWQDGNSDGVVDEGELMTLGAAGVQSLNTGYENHDPTASQDEYSNQHRQTGSYTKTDGTTAGMDDVWYIIDPPYRKDREELQVGEDIAALPDVMGYGRLHDLHQAMVRDASGVLQELVGKFLEEEDASLRRDISIDIIYAWADAENSRGAAINTTGSIDRRKIVSLIQFYGYDVGSMIIRPEHAYLYEKAFNSMVEYVEATLNAQSHYAELADAAMSVMVTAKVFLEPFDIQSFVAVLDEVYNRSEADKISVLNFLKEFSACGKPQDEFFKAIRSEYAEHLPVTENYADGDISLETALSMAGLNVWNMADYDNAVWVTHLTDNFITGTDRNDAIDGADGIDTIFGGGGIDRINGFSGDDRLFGGAGNDDIRGGNGNDRLYGDAGNDILYGNAGDDVLHGGSGDDRMWGGAGNDVYRFNRGDGNDTIFEEGTEADRRNVIRLGEGIGTEDIEFLALQGGVGNSFHFDLVIRIKDTGETLTVYNGMSSSNTNVENSYSIQAIEFADGTVWEWEDIVSQTFRITDESGSYVSNRVEGGVLYGTITNNTLNGSANPDELYGGAGNDILQGNAGDDVLHGESGADRMWGGAGNDVYLFNRGDGHDTIYEEGTDIGRWNVIRLGEGIETDDIEFLVLQGGVGNSFHSDLIIRIKDTGETLTVYNGMSSSNTNVENSYSIQAIEFADGTVWEWEDIVARPFQVTDESGPYISNRVEGGVLCGMAVNNTLNGSANPDELYGGDGNDILYGKAGDDVLHGGSGADRMWGGSGDDVYLFNRGDGNDLIYEEGTDVGRWNIIRLGEGIETDDIEFLVLQGGVANSFHSDLIIRIKDTGETLTVYNGMSSSNSNVENPYSIQAIEFADGTVWEWDDIVSRPFQITDESGSYVSNRVEGGVLYGTITNNTLNGSANPDALHGGAGNDTLYGNSGDDTLHGGSGNDTMHGGVGDDVYLFNRGDGHDTIYETSGDDTLQFGEGIDLYRLKFGHSGNSLVIDILGTNDKVTINNWYSSSSYRVENIVANGASLDTTDIANLMAEMDSLGEPQGANGTWSESQKTELALIAEMFWEDVSPPLDFNDSPYLGETVAGTNGDDILHGVAGNDRLEGGTGNDVYLFNLGDGHDVIHDADSNPGFQNVIRFGEDIDTDDIEFILGGKRVFSGSAYFDLVIRIKSTGETLTIEQGMRQGGGIDASNHSIQAIEFDDGTVWEWADIVAQPFLVQGNCLGATVYAPYEGGILVGNDNPNTLAGYGGADELHGGSGDETLIGNAGDDVLHGGEGDDRMEGGTGNDVYLFNLGDGHDVIYDADSNPGFQNVIRFGAGIATDDIEFILGGKRVFSGSAYFDLVIRIKSTGETLTIEQGMRQGGGINTSNHSIQAIEFDDGTVWEWADIVAQPFLVPGNYLGATVYAPYEGGILVGNANPNTLVGNGNADELHGGSGDETLIGNAGDDLFHGGAGNDRLEGGTGNDVYLFNLGDGHDVIHDVDFDLSFRNVVRFGEGIASDDIEFILGGKRMFSGSAYFDLVIRIKSTGETLTIEQGMRQGAGINTSYYAIQAIEFADGTVWNWADIVTQPFLVPGDCLGATVYAPYEGGILVGNANPNTLAGFGGADEVYGGTGDETLIGNAGADLLHGGAGNDRLEGGDGNDVYLFNLGDGHDVIAETGTGIRSNVIRFGEGITEDDIELSMGANNFHTPSGHIHTDLIIRIKSTGETLTIENGLSKTSSNQNNSYSIQVIEFADGAVWEWADIIQQPLIVPESYSKKMLYTAYEGGILINNGGGNELHGSDTADELYGGSGNDVLTAGNGDDILHGGVGNDRMDGGSGSDIYIFNLGDGHDVIYDCDGNNYTNSLNIIRFGEGISWDDLEFLLKPGKYSGYSNLVIRIKSTDETLTIEQGLAHSALNANNPYSIQAIEFADGTVWEWEDIIGKSMQISGFKGTTVYAAPEGGILIGNEHNNTLQAYYNTTWNELYGGSGNETLKGGNGDDILHGGAGVDHLEGGTGDDVYLFNLGDGDDVINDYDSRPAKRNIIRFGEGISGDDLEFLLKPGKYSGYSDLIIRIKSTGETLTIEQGLAHSALNTNNSYSIQAIEFSDGTVWEWEDVLGQPMLISDDFTGTTVYAPPEGGILIGNEYDNILQANYSSSGNELYGGSGNETLKGGNGDDILHGGLGDDRMEGGTGDDVYLFNPGDGDDVICDYENRPAKRNIIRFGEGIDGDSLEFLLKPNAGYMDLVIRIKSSGETLTIERGMYSTANASNQYSIQTIEFADGTVWEWEDIVKQPIYLSDSFSGSVSISQEGGILFGNANNNTLTGSSTNANELYGGSGGETLRGGSDKDVLHGGRGADQLEGGADDDLYLFNIGDGQDTISDTAGTDTLHFGAGIDLYRVRFEHSGSSLVIKVLGTDDAVTVLNWYSNASYRLESIVVDGAKLDTAELANLMTAMDALGEPQGANGAWSGDQRNALAAIAADYWEETTPPEPDNIVEGTSSGETLTGTDGNDLIIGGVGDDQLEGGSGNDTYVYSFGDGNDVIHEDDSGSNKWNVIRLADLGSDDIELRIAPGTADGYLNLVVRVKSSGETLTVANAFHPNAANRFNPHSIQAIVFADGTTWEWGDIVAKPLYQDSTSSNTLTLGAEGLHVVGNDADNIIHGGAKNDTIFGGEGDDAIYGGAGADTLNGGAGIDHLEGGAGNDTYIFNRGDGSDAIFDASGLNVLILDASIAVTDICLSRSGDDLLLRVIPGTEDGVTALGWFSNTSNRLSSVKVGGFELSSAMMEQILSRQSLIGTPEGEDGTWSAVQKSELEEFVNGLFLNSIHGTSADETLNGTVEDDIFHGGAGNDRLEGGVGDDVYVFNLGDGHDVISDYEYRSGKRNVIRFGEGISGDSLEFTLKASTSSSYMDLVILIKESGETVTVERGIYNATVNANNYYSIQVIEFADGTAWEWSDIAAHPMHLSGTIANATVYALAEGGVMIGNENDNVLQGATSVVNALYGGDGDDTLKGGSLGDVLHGEAGDDRLEGGVGDDVYVFNLGDGHDVISDYEYRPGKRNVLRFGEGISGDSLEFTLKASTSSSYMDLVILIKETGETVTVERGIYNATVNANNYYSIQAIEFADGTAWEWSDIAARPMHLSGTIANATVYALAEGGILIGNENDNVLQGATSVANVLYGGAGDDTLKGGNLGDVLYGEAGDDRLEGGSGDDVYVFNLGDGHDVISDYEYRSGKRNVLRFGEGISGDSLEFTLKASTSSNYMDLVILIKESGETVTVERGIYNATVNANNYYSIQAIEFADGTAWEWSDMAARPMHLSGTIANATVHALADGGILIDNEYGNTLQGSSVDDRLLGGSGNDTLKGNNGNDILHGGAGDDSLDGGAGDDVYLFNLGDGHDVISDYEYRTGKNNVVRLGEGITAANIELLAKPTNGNYSDLIIRIKSTGETITVLSGMLYNTANSANYYSIQSIEFADDTVWEWSDIAAQPMTLMEGSYNNYGYAASEGGILHGNAADNKMWGSAYADALYGGAGNDTLFGYAGDDILHGGAGDDSLDGGAGDDVYLFNLGDGHDVISDYEYRTGKRNVIRFGAGITAANIEFLAKPTNGNYSDLIIRIKSTGETITVLNGMLYNTANSSNYYSIQSIEFADGTVWEWSDIAAQPMTVMEGSYSNYGYAAFEGGILHGNAADNKMWGSANADALYGGAGADTLLGYAGDDILHGGAGADRLEGGAGDDVYLFNLGDGHDVIYDYEYRTGKNNVIRLGEGITAANIEFLAKPTNGNYSDLIIRLKSTGETITVLNGLQYNVADSANYYSIQAIEFADGTVWEWSDIAAQPMTVMEGSYNNYGYTASEGGILHGNAADNKMWGSVNADALYGGAGDDTLLGDAGNDILHGGTGNDRLEGGSGNDTYHFNLGDGQDTIYDTAGTDSLIFGDDVDITDLWFARSGNNLIINVADADNSVTVQNWYSGASYQVESIQSGGMELVHTQMDQMIQALASFGAPAGVDGGWTDEQKEALQPVIAAYWHTPGA